MSFKHGHNKRNERSRTYSSWFNMKQRCNNPAHSRAATYSEKGIVYQDSWELFENFLADMGECPERIDALSLERRDNKGNYTKENCYWATAREQAQNRSDTLRPDNVRLIKALLRSIKPGTRITYARRLLAELFRVSHSTITYIDRGFTWSNIK